MPFPGSAERDFGGEENFVFYYRMCIVEIEASTIPEQIARNNTFDNIAGIEKSVIVYFGFFFFSSHELLCFVCGNLKLFGFRDIEFQNVDI